MNKDELLRYYDGLIGMLVAIDNQSERSCFNTESTECKDELLRYYDGLIGMLVAIDNQSERSCFNTESTECIEQIRKLIVNMDELKEVEE